MGLADLKQKVICLPGDFFYFVNIMYVYLVTKNLFQVKLLMLTLCQFLKSRCSVYF